MIEGTSSGGLHKVERGARSTPGTLAYSDKLEAACDLLILGEDVLAQVQ
jgi:hypothetical protein